MVITSSWTMPSSRCRSSSSASSIAASVASLRDAASASSSCLKALLTTPRATITTEAFITSTIMSWKAPSRDAFWPDGVIRTAANSRPEAMA